MHKSSIDVKLTTAAVSAEKRSAIHCILQLLLFLTFEVDRHSKFLNIKQTKTLYNDYFENIVSRSLIHSTLPLFHISSKQHSQ